jgi:enamine deaminase RidA (YjgF/YER057c/UK114 family)
MGRIDDRLKELGITLPRPRRVPANFVPAVRVGDLLYVSGTLGTVVSPQDEDVIPLPGKVGEVLTLEEGYASARQCAINHLAWIKQALGSLDLVKQVVKVNGYVNAPPGYDRAPWVINGASDLLVQVFGEEAGRHARASVSVAGLAFMAPVETEMIVEVFRS